VGPLYDAVALGMWAYTNAAFKVKVLGERRFRIEPGTLIVSTHRRESDVPVICPPLFYGGQMWRHRKHRMSFAARDDMFLPGFFAGFPPGLSPRVRQLLNPIGVGRFLPRVQVHPISSANVSLAAEIVRAHPDAELAELLPGPTVEVLSERAEARGLPRPTHGRDVRSSDYVDLLWTAVTRDDLPALEDFWARKAARAAGDFRELVEVVRAGSPLVVFPEGRPSPDGEIGPLRRGLAALVRRAQPSWFFPVGLAYDPLVGGRTRVLVAVGPRVQPPGGEVEEATLALLKRQTPLTVGQFVAHELLAGREPADEALAETARLAVAEERPLDPDLRDRERRRARLAEARAAADGQPDELPFLAREYASARAL
jgi:1-acyl-sn-glycerol-3-phosphate acyltransferase